MRYAIAAAVAAVVILGGCLYVWTANRAVRTYLREQYLALQREGKLDPALQGLDPDNLPLGSLEVTVPSELQIRLSLAALLSAFWPVLVALVLLLAFGAAYVSQWLLPPRPVTVAKVPAQRPGPPLEPRDN